MYPVPAVIYDVYYYEWCGTHPWFRTCICIWERSGTKYRFNRKVWQYNA